jgi:hypothetical protein
VAGEASEVGEASDQNVVPAQVHLQITVDEDVSEARRLAQATSELGW